MTYAHKLTADDRRLDWTRPAVEIDRVVRALAPDIGARTELDGRPALDLARGSASPGPAAIPARCCRRSTVSCGEGAYEILELQPAGQAPDAGGRVSQTACASRRA